SRQTRLARLGFIDAARVDAGAAAADIGFDTLVEIAGGADPDLAFAALVQLIDAARRARGLDQGNDAAGLEAALHNDVAFRRRLFAVLGASNALGDHLSSHPGDWIELADPTFEQRRPTVWGLTATLVDAVGERTGAAAEDALR